MDARLSAAPVDSDLGPGEVRSGALGKRGVPGDLHGLAFRQGLRGGGDPIQRGRHDPAGRGVVHRAEPGDRVQSDGGSRGARPVYREEGQTHDEADGNQNVAAFRYALVAALCRISDVVRQVLRKGDCRAGAAVGDDLRRIDCPDENRFADVRGIRRDPRFASGQSRVGVRSRGRGRDPAVPHDSGDRGGRLEPGSSGSVRVCDQRVAERPVCAVRGLLVSGTCLRPPCVGFRPLRVRARVLCRVRCPARVGRIQRGGFFRRDGRSLQTSCEARGCGPR